MLLISSCNNGFCSSFTVFRRYVGSGRFRLRFKTPSSSSIMRITSSGSDGAIGAMQISRTALNLPQLFKCSFSKRKKFQINLLRKTNNNNILLSDKSIVNYTPHIINLVYILYTYVQNQNRIKYFAFYLRCILCEGNMINNVPIHVMHIIIDSYRNVCSFKPLLCTVSFKTLGVLIWLHVTKLIKDE